MKMAKDLKELEERAKKLKSVKGPFELDRVTEIEIIPIEKIKRIEVKTIYGPDRKPIKNKEGKERILE